MNPLVNGMVSRYKVGFLGAGNLAQSILAAFHSSKAVDLKNVFVSNRTPEKLVALKKEYSELNICQDNDELLQSVKIVILSVKPQDLVAAIQTTRHAFTEDHIVISLAAGVTLEMLKKLLPQVENIVRWMPNTPIRIGQAVVGYSFLKESEITRDIVVQLLSAVGLAVAVEEGDEMNALTVACGSGPAFIYEFMQIWQSWIESYGFDAETSKIMTVETFLGAVKLAASQPQLSLVDLQNQVVSKKGVTHAGLTYMRSLEMEDTVNAGLEKSIARIKELEQEVEKEFNKKI